MKMENCKICDKRESIVLCANCKESNCGSPISCCFAFPYTEETELVICHSCYNEINRKLKPYREYVNEKLICLKQHIKKRQIALQS